MKTFAFLPSRCSFLALFFAASLLFWPMRLAAAEDAGAPPTDQAIQKALDDRVASGANPGLLLGVVDAAGTRYFTSGKADDAGKRALNEDLVFEIGSITKVFTGVLLAEAVLSGFVSLDDPLAALLPLSYDSPKIGAITLLQLASHASGLPRMPDNFKPKDAKNPYADYGPQELKAALASQAPGASGAYLYSNYGSGLLGYVLALRYGEDYATLIKQRVLTPLGINNTGAGRDAAIADRMAQGHNAGGEPAPDWDFDALAGCGALRSTGRDMARFLAANLGLAKTPLKKALALAALPRSPGPEEHIRMGLGWHILDAKGKTIVFHDGGTGGFRAFIGFDHQGGRGAFVLSNASVDVSDLGFFALDKRAPLRASRQVAALSPDAFARYAGRYRMVSDDQEADGLTVIVAVKGRGLSYKQEGGDEENTLYPANETEFFFKSTADATVVFRLEEE